MSRLPAWLVLGMSGRAIEGRHSRLSRLLVIMGSPDFNPAGPINRPAARLLPCRPLAMLFRDAGAATVTVLHRTSYRELFADANSAEVGLVFISVRVADIFQCSKQRCS